MIAAFLLSVLPSPAGPTLIAAPRVQEAGADVDAQIAAAGTDVAKLMELAETLKTAGNDDGAKAAWKKVVEIDPNHEDAHKKLRHHFYDGKWFESYAELSKYRREETAKMKEKGLVKFKDQWVPEADLPYLNMGWVKDEASGKFSNPIEAARTKQIEEWKSKGYTFRADDSTWIAPEDVSKWTQLLWKCGEEWLDMAKANEFHSQIGQWWQLEGEHFIVWSTTEWDAANSARWYADQTYQDLVRLFGMHPEKKPHFVVLNSLDQYNQAAGGQSPLQETEGISSLHGAYFADAFFYPDPATQVIEFHGCGVSWWDRKDQKLAPWGPYWLRWAAAQSYCEAIDPSWLAVSEAIAAAGSGGGGTPGAFWAEKKIPRWLRYGAASYAERYMKNPDAGDGGNVWELRDFAFGEIKKAGSLRKLEDIFAFALDLNDLDASSRLYHEAGLVVSYLLDGADGDKKLREKHQAFKIALKNALAGGPRKELDEAIEALQKELAKNQKDIEKFAGI
jgi:hypothetical protein